MSPVYILKSKSYVKHFLHWPIEKKQHMIYYSHTEREKDYICRVLDRWSSWSEYQILERNGWLPTFSSHYGFVTFPFHVLARNRPWRQKGRLGLINMMFLLSNYISWFCYCVAKFPSFVTFHQLLVLLDSVTLYTWEHILMDPALHLLNLKLLPILIMIYSVQLWEGIQCLIY